MRFADELRGSEGERCTVTDLRTGTIHKGVVEEWDDKTKMAVVRYDSRTRVRAGFSFVNLVDDEA